MHINYKDRDDRPSVILNGIVSLLLEPQIIGP